MEDLWQSAPKYEVKQLLNHFFFCFPHFSAFTSCPFTEPKPYSTQCKGEKKLDEKLGARQPLAENSSFFLYTFEAVYV